MKKRDILGLIRLDVQRKNKPKKKLDDFLLGEEDAHEEIMKSKRNSEKPKRKSNPLEEQLGMSKSDEAAKKPNIKQLDWGSLSRMSNREQNITLKREYLALLEKIEELADSIAEEKSGNSEKAIRIEKFKREDKLMRDFVRAIVELIPNGYELKVQMDTTAWEVAEIEEEVLGKINSLVSKVKFTDKIIEEETKTVTAQKQFLENEFSRAKERIRELEEALSNRMESGQDAEHNKVDEDVNLDENNNSAVNTTPEVENKPAKETQVQDKKIVKKESPIPSRTVEKKKDTLTPSSSSSVTASINTDEVPKYLFIETDRYLENFSDECKLTLNVIGKTGVSRNAELKIEMEKLEEGKKYFFPNGHYEYGYLNNAVKTLKDRQFITSKEINLGARGYKFLVYELTDIGKAAYYKFNQEQPVEAEMYRMLADHKSLEHGYLIREVANEFRAKNYTVHEDRETCTYKLKDGHRKVFDLIIEKDGQKKFIEVERGTHNYDDFFKAMDKIYQVTNEFHFVAPNEKILYKETKGKVFKWITDRLGGFENAKGKMTMCFSTIEKIKKSDEPWEIFRP